jgi:pyruvate,water dikinase
MGVLLQEMVAPVAAGVVFTRNPLTGIDETIIEAVAGTGEALLQAGAAPARWIVRDGTVQAGTAATLLDGSLISAIAGQAKKIERAFGRPADLEWAYDGRQLYWLQLREITALRSGDIYTNYFSKEFLPGLLKPLVWSVNISIVNHAWKRMLTELIGANDIDIMRLGRLWRYRAYFNTGVIGSIFEQVGLPARTMELLLFNSIGARKRTWYRPTLRGLRFVPRLCAFLADKLRFERRIKHFIAEAAQRFDGLREQLAGSRSPQDVIAVIDALVERTRDSSYYNLVTHLLMYAHEHIRRIFSRRDGLAALPSAADALPYPQEQYDPAAHFPRLKSLFACLPADMRESVRTGSLAALQQEPGAAQFRAALEAFLHRFGHLSDSGNDFSCSPWREMPGEVLRMMLTCDASPERSRTAPAGNQSGSVSGFFERRAAAFRRYKEITSFIHTFGYSLFRDSFLELGTYLCRSGCLEAREDIFYLYVDEVRQAVAGRTDARDCVALVAGRKREMADCIGDTAPDFIFGDYAPTPVPPRGRLLQGVPVSRGIYQGPARVVRGIQEAQKLCPGDVLVVAHADIGLMPLFARAGAVVAESGGTLSHCSIVAREFNLPAIVSVPGACAITDNTLVIVNGYTGEVVLQNAGGLCEAAE